MKLLVLGATGATGQLVIEQSVAAGHQVRALVRTPAKLTTTSPLLDVLTGQATDPGDVAEAMDGVDAVISTLGAMKGTVVSDAVRAVIEAARVSGLKRVVVMESFGVNTDRLSAPLRLMTNAAMGSLVKDQAAAEALLRASDLDWTVVQAVRLTNGPATGDARVLAVDERIGMRDSVSRADVAGFLLASAVDPADTSRRSVGLG